MPIKEIPLEEMNSLARARRNTNLSRVELSMRCRGMTSTNTQDYTTVSSDTIRRLELGLTKPRFKTAQTLAKVLKLDVGELFPDGIDNEVRNPEGVTRIASDRAKRAMAKKHKLASMLFELLDALEIPYHPKIGTPERINSEVDDISFGVHYPELRLMIIAGPKNNKKYRMEKEVVVEASWSWIETSEQEVENSFTSLAIRVLVEVIYIIHERNPCMLEKETIPLEA